MKEWLEDEARRFFEDRSSIVSRIMSRTATLLIAANVLMDERKQLMEMANEMIGLRPSVSKPLLEAEFNSFLKQLGKPPLKADYKINLDRHGMSESDRIANISDIEIKFKELCRRNSIAPEEPLTPEMQKRAQQVISDLKQAAAPIEVAIKRLREK